MVTNLVCELQIKNIFSFNGTFDLAASTSFVHDGVTMTEYENEPFIVGDYNHNQVEFMHLSHEKWKKCINST